MFASATGHIILGRSFTVADHSKSSRFMPKIRDIFHAFLGNPMLYFILFFTAASNVFSMGWTFDDPKLTKSMFLRCPCELIVKCPIETSGNVSSNISSADAISCKGIVAQNSRL